MQLTEAMAELDAIVERAYEKLRSGVASPPTTAERIIDRISERWRNGSRRCPLCGSLDWLAGDGFIQMYLTTHPFGSRQMRQCPLVPLACAGCGDTHLLNLLILGFTEQELGEMSVALVGV